MFARVIVFWLTQSNILPIIVSDKGGIWEIKTRAGRAKAITKDKSKGMYSKLFKQ